MKQLKRAAQKGFTLVELLIVVIILAILAAIVVPQFASSTDEAKIASLDSTLANMRGAIDLYYQQHGKYPSSVAATGATCPSSGTAGTGAIDTAQAFTDQLSMYTNASGQACSTSDATFKYGPYLKKATLPANPVTGSSALLVVNTGNLNLTGSGAGLGWRFDNKVGKFIANDTNTDPSGVKYDAH
jgi:prepilin-type N-terminal cleavage/methylation domain-containing protein